MWEKYTSLHTRNSRRRCSSVTTEAAYAAFSFDFFQFYKVQKRTEKK